MANIYTIDNTAGDIQFDIHPGMSNGPDSSAQNSDFHLFGMGSSIWGEKINENMYHLGENSACPSKELGDHLPGGSPVLHNTNYDPSINAIMPKDALDLGNGLGINIPINGQTWYNTTNKSLYMYDNILGWKSTINGIYSGSPLIPTTGSLGDFLYDTVDGSIRAYNGSEFARSSIMTFPSIPHQGDFWFNGSPLTLQVCIYNIASPVEWLALADERDVATINATITALDISLSGALATHAGDTTLHLTSVQNTLLDSLSGTLTATELNYSDGLTSNIQAQFNAINATDISQQGEIDALNTDLTQLSNNIVPIGSELYWPNEIPPTGWFEEDGSAKNVKLYLDLCNVLGNGARYGGYYTASVVLTAYHDATNELEMATPYANDDAVFLSSNSDTLPTGLQDFIIYYVINASGSRFQLSLTEGGAAVTFSTSPVATSTYLCDQFLLPYAQGKFVRCWAHGSSNDPDRNSRTSVGWNSSLAGDHVGSEQADDILSHTHIYWSSKGTGYAGDWHGGGSSYRGSYQDSTFATGGLETRPLNTYRMLIIKY